MEVYSKYIEKIDSALDKELELYSESEFCEPLKYALAGVKRIRPIITLLQLSLLVRLMRMSMQEHVQLNYFIQNQSFMTIS